MREESNHRPCTEATESPPDASEGNSWRPRLLPTERFNHARRGDAAARSAPGWPRRLRGWSQSSMMRACARGRRRVGARRLSARAGRADWLSPPDQQTSRARRKGCANPNLLAQPCGRAGSGAHELHRRGVPHCVHASDVHLPIVKVHLKPRDGRRAHGHAQRRSRCDESRASFSRPGVKRPAHAAA